MQRESLDLIRDLNAQREAAVNDPEINTRISAYELAYRMQTSAPELTDLSKEDPKTLAMYGAKPGEASFANNCLLARRLVERGVRFVNLYHEAWDHHTDVAGGLKAQCGETDQASAALITDLKQRGLLDETLVIWGGEFGRTPMVENNPAIGRSMGRDHHPKAYSMWMAGGGIKPGITTRPDRRHRLQHRRRPGPRSRSSGDASCICWASITPSSPTTTRAAISG